jgi:hypothetical protein
LESLEPDDWLSEGERAFIRDPIMCEDLEALEPLTRLARHAFLAVTADGRGRRTGGSAVEFIERSVVAGRRREAGWRFAAATRQSREAVAARVRVGLVRAACGVVECPDQPATTAAANCAGGLGWCQHSRGVSRAAAFRASRAT